MRRILGSLKKPDRNSIEFHQQLGKSTITLDVFKNHSGSFFWVSQILFHCIQIYLRNLTKMR
jgi:hypothetical protein